MSRLHPVEKVCLKCNKNFLAKRSDAKFCSGSCKALYNNIASATPAIIEEAIVPYEETIKNQEVLIDTLESVLARYRKYIFDYKKALIGTLFEDNTDLVDSVTGEIISLDEVYFRAEARAIEKYKAKDNALNGEIGSAGGQPIRPDRANTLKDTL